VSYAVDSTAVAASAAHAVARLREARMIDRPLHVPRLEEELQLFHQLSTDIFGDSWGFSEISLEEFRSIYRPLAQFVDAELVRILETPSGAAVGFGFGIPGVRHPRPGGFVIKTLGVLPRARHGHPGIGAGLTALIHQAARERGYVGGIHALMTQGSMAHRLSKRWGMHLRSYATFERSAP
jgi:hypothetical protein